MPDRPPTTREARRTTLKICGITDVANGLVAIDAGADYLGFVFYPPSIRFLEVAAATRLVYQLRAARPSGWRAVGVFVNESLEVVERAVRTAELDIVQLNGEETPEYVRQVGVPVFKAVRFQPITSPLSPTLPRKGGGRTSQAPRASSSTIPGERGGRTSQAPRASSSTIPGEGGGRTSQAPHLSSSTIPGEGGGTRQSVVRGPQPAIPTAATFGAERILVDANVPGRYGGTGVTYNWSAVRLAVADGFLAGGLTAANVAEAIERARPWGLDVSSGVERDGVKHPELIQAFIAAVRAAERRLQGTGGRGRAAGSSRRANAR